MPASRDPPEAHDPTYLDHARTAGRLRCVAFAAWFGVVRRLAASLAHALSAASASAPPLRPRAPKERPAHGR